MGRRPQYFLAELRRWDTKSIVGFALIMADNAKSARAKFDLEAKSNKKGYDNIYNWKLGVNKAIKTALVKIHKTIV